MSFLRPEMSLDSRPASLLPPEATGSDGPSFEGPELQADAVIQSVQAARNQLAANPLIIFLGISIILVHLRRDFRRHVGTDEVR